MNKSVFRFGEFQGKKRGGKLNETVIAFDDHYKVRVNIDIPFSLVSSYVKKIKDESGQDIKRLYSDMEIAEEIAKYVSTSYLNIENIPGDVLMPEKQGLIQGGVQGQGQVQLGGQQIQDLDLGDEDFDLGQGQLGQLQGQPQLQGQKPQRLQGQGQKPQFSQQSQTQRTAQQIQPREQI